MIGHEERTAVAPPATVPAEPGWDHLRTSRRLGRAAAVTDYLLIVAGLLSLLVTDRHLIGDGARRYDALTQLLTGGGLSTDRYSLLGPLFSAPMWWLGRAAGDPRVWLSHYNLVLFVVALGLLFALLRRRVDAVLLRRFLLLLVAGSMIAPHVSDFYGETFTAMTVGVGALCAVAVVGPRALRLAGWVAMTLGGANTMSTLPALGLVGLRQGARTHRLRYVLPVLVAAAVALAESWARRGDPFDQGYGAERFDFPVVLGVLAILLSFGKGLVFFTPGLLLPARRRLRGLYDPAAVDLWRGHEAWLVLVAGLVVVYGGWWAWNGDLYWGPRFFLLAIFPASLALAAWLTHHDSRPSRNLALLAVLALSLWVGANSTIFEMLLSPTCFPLATKQEDFCRYGVLESRLWYPFLSWPRDLSATRWAQLDYHALVLYWLALPVVIRSVPEMSRRVRQAARRLPEWRL
ncbi:hypothetical protein R8Z50_24380 [Longispora sp. K20-0274]|uniref:hypothetical protein n=1 Tax=Longispora sp. K20-0274 TaxID=3088255 RepID=UPI00399A6AD6